jgi:hypothetical protein
MKKSVSPQQKKPYKVRMCETTGKRGFKVKAQAMDAARRATELSRPTEVYRCLDCRKWHLASRETRAQRRERGAA